MKRTVIDEEGSVCCPRCGAKNSFALKRTGKAKVMTFGAAMVLAPKRLRCNGCGTSLKAGGARPAQAEAPSRREGLEKKRSLQQQAKVNRKRRKEGLPPLPYQG